MDIIKKHNILSGLVIAFIIFASQIAHAGPQKALKKGFILNDAGEKCWYTQEFKDQVVYFTKKHTQDIGVIKFENTKCMTRSEFGFDINKANINKIISKWYSHEDANFLTSSEELLPSSMLQIKGQCMQSRTYSSRGVLIDYIIEENSIKEVVHGSSAGACQNK